jgi:putative flavoprotein involved in K+ transport
MGSGVNSTKIQTIVIGGGQAGLAAGYHLAKRGLPFLILDANARVGDAWRLRWDSLRLFTPARYAGLPGMRFPAPGSSFPNKQQVADYLFEYARRFRLPVRNSVRVDRLWKEDGRFMMSAGNRRFEAENVIVAMANYQVPRIPSFARELRPDIVQLHSHDYRNPQQLQKGGVLVVGVGNSGADIALEVAQSHPTWISGKESGQIPWPIETFISRHFLFRLIRFIGHHVLTVKTPIGRRARPKMLHRAAPLVRVKPQDLTKAGVEYVPRVVGVKDGLPLLADDRFRDVQNVIWCTGYECGFSWIDLPIFDDQRDPVHDNGVVANVLGMYFVGLHFLYAMSSATLIGIGRDAERVVNVLASKSQYKKSASATRLLSLEPRDSMNWSAQAEAHRVHGEGQTTRRCNQLSLSSANRELGRAVSLSAEPSGASTPSIN